MEFQKKTIWIKEQTKDTYAEFVGSFDISEKEKILLQLGFDGHSAVYLNEELVFFGAAGDYPWHRLYYQVDLTDHCKEHNEIRFVIWYPGEDSSTYITKEPGLAFSIAQKGKVLIESGSHILSRKVLSYKNEYCKWITIQLGCSFFYDNIVENTLPWEPSVESGEEIVFHLRTTGELVLGEPVPTGIEPLEDGFLVDMKEEVVGFLNLDFESPCEQTVTISYGEHLVDGQVQRLIDGRDFSVEFRAKKGQNQYLNPFRRLAGRYLQVQCKEPLKISYVGLRPTDRPVVEIPRTFADPDFQKIYEVSVNTLKKCMHEHYEDCPWREQAMYTLDSRNQMLCGYYAFEDAEYVRENLRFIGKGQREDGLLSLCFPAGTDLPIPFFSLVYLMQLQDYLVHTKDRELVLELKPVVDTIAKTFQSHMDDNGLIPNFPAPCWNFYEWAEGSDNAAELQADTKAGRTKKYDLILNCMYVYFTMLYEEVYGEVLGDREACKRAIQDTFYVPEKGLYKLSTIGELYSQLGNSFAILIGLGDEKLAERITTEDSLIEVTLSMHTFYYDALLLFGDTYKSFILQDIKEKYGHMLQEGATTFWETAKGWRDFGNAGSLCHGWSAVPVYYLCKLVEE